MPDLTSKYPTSNLLVTILFNLYIFVWWLEIGKRIPLLGAIRFEFILGGILVIIALTNYASNPREGKYNSKLTTWILIYIFTLFVSLPLSADFNIAWDAFFNRIVKYSLMCFFISQFVISPRMLKLFSFTTFLAFLKIGQEAMVGKISGNMVWENQGIPRLHGATGTMFGHPNSLSGKTLTLLPFLYYFWPTLKKNWIKCLVILQIIFSLNIVLFTGSRTGYLTFITLVFLIVVLSRKKSGIIILAIILSISSIAFIPDSYKERFFSSFQGEEKEGRSKDARKELFFDSITVFMENPLGVGGQCFPVVQESKFRRVQETHNLYTQILAETGIQGFFAFAGLILVLLKKINNLRQEFRNCSERINKFSSSTNCTKNDSLLTNCLEEELSVSRLGIATADALYVALIVRLILGIFGHDLFEIYWWIFCGLSMSLASMLHIHEKRISEFCG